MATWTDAATARAHWPDAASLPDATLARLLEAASVQCAAYATDALNATVTAALATATTVPAPAAMACILQARELYAASLRDGDVIGGPDYAIRSRPLTGAVKALLRPDRGRPVIG